MPLRLVAGFTQLVNQGISRGLESSQLLVSAHESGYVLSTNGRCFIGTITYPATKTTGVIVTAGHDAQAGPAFALARLGGRARVSQ